MSYTPKSKHQILKSSGNQYKDPRTGGPYVGPYILTSEGAFIGNSVYKPGPKLIEYNLGRTSQQGNIYYYKNTKDYNQANFNNMLNEISSFKPIISTKNKPTDKDYQKGHYIRYFCKRRNMQNVFYEIDKKTYKSLIGGKTYDFFLHMPGSLKWAIDGDIMTINRKILAQKERDYPHISKFFTKLNEFQKIRKTLGGELKYKDGRNYIGYYHVHIKQNSQTIPMAGMYHIPTKHEELEYVNSTKNIERTPTVEEPKQPTGYVAPQNIQSQIPTPNTPSSGGGGGGY